MYVQHGESALHIAAGNGKLGIVDALCKNNATLNITDKVSTEIHGV